MDLPIFSYHPDPILSGSIDKSTAPCQCCERARGYVSNASMYAAEDIHQICPWCIADGSAAKKFDGAFSVDDSLISGKIAPSIIDEVCLRTPGYRSLQQDVWQHHCKDACEYHGSPSTDDLNALSPEQFAALFMDNGIPRAVGEKITAHYAEGSNVQIYKFECRHCSQLIYTLDFT